MDDDNNDDTIRRIIKLPGYEAQLTQSGISHSNYKLNKHSTELLSFLSLSTPPHNNNNNNTIIKLKPLTNEKQSINYRCKCSFQFIILDDDNATNTIEYAMRSNGKIIPLGMNYFPIALPSIQNIMKLLNIQLNNKKYHDNNNNNSYRYSILRYNISSCTFISSWDEKENVITLNYSSCILDNEKGWKNEAMHLFKIINNELVESNDCDNNKIIAIIGRSKNVEIIIDHDSTISNNTINNDDLSLNINDKDNRIGRKEEKIKKKLMIHDCITLPIINTKQELVVVEQQQQRQIRKQSIYYIKSIDAFQHPNGYVMNQALQWLLQMSYDINNNSETTAKTKNTTLIEFYCGYGAHTMPLIKLGHYTNVIAIDIDHRLLLSFVENIKLNNDNDDNNNNNNCNITILQGDVQKLTNDIIKYNKNPPWFSTHTTKHKIYSSITTVQQKDNNDDTTNVLLVDPPRCGLGETTCQYILQEISIKYVLYISCNIHSLQKDLSLLVKQQYNNNNNEHQHSFTIQDCTLLDLFPRTTSIETLICLKRD